MDIRWYLNTITPDIQIIFIKLGYFCFSTISAFKWTEISPSKISAYVIIHIFFNNSWDNSYTFDYYILCKNMIYKYDI